MAGSDALKARELANAALRETERGAYASAFKLYASAAALAPSDADLLFNYASLARITGSLALAESLLTRVVALRPGDSAAWLLLSGLRRWSAGDNHVASMRRVLGEITGASAGSGSGSGSGSPRQRVELLYALAKECEDIEDYAAARDYLQQGAALRRKHLRYDVRDDVTTMAALRDLVDELAGSRAASASASASAATETGPTPIFIVSLPRAGSTLLERMLSTDSRIAAGGELPFFPQLVGRALQQAYIARNGKLARPKSKAELVTYATELDWPQIGRDYLQMLRQAGHGDAPYVIDKMPLNFLNIGFLRRALPQARIIYLQRDPDDHALALYKHLFNEAYPWSYDLTEISAYTDAARNLCTAASAHPTNHIFTLSYEDLVQKPQRSLRDLIDYCGIDWSDGAYERALQFNESNKNASTTGSASQVRNALHARSIGLAAKYHLFD